MRGRQHNSYHFRWVGAQSPPAPPKARVSGAPLARFVVQAFPTGFPGTKCQLKHVSFLQTRRHSLTVCGSGSPRPLWSGHLRLRLTRWPPEGAEAASRGLRTQASELHKVRPGPATRCPCLGRPSDAGHREDPLCRTRPNNDHQPENPVGSLCDLHQRLVLVETGSQAGDSKSGQWGTDSKAPPIGQ